MIGSATGPRIGITGLGTHVPERVLTNAELAEIVDTSDEWILERTGIRERRIAAKEEALTDIARPAALAALADAGVEASEIDLVICATVTPGHDVPDLVRDPGRRARDAEGGGVRPARRLHGLRLRAGPGVRDARVGPLAAEPRDRRRRALQDPRLGRPLDARALRRRRRRGRHGAASSREAFSASSSARTAAEVRTSGFRARARATSTTRTPT